MKSAIKNEWIVTFIQDYLPRLPDDILIQIFDQLTFEYLIAFFLHFPTGIIQDLLIRHYYSHKLCFAYITKNLYYISYWELRNKADELITFGEQWINEGLNILAKVIPKKLVLVCSDEFVQMKRILELECIKNIPELEIIIRPFKDPIKSFHDLPSLPNLTKLYSFNIEFSCIRKDYLALRNHNQLAEFMVSLCDGYDDWSEIEFSQGLTSLSLNQADWCEYGIHKSTLVIPKSIQRLEITDVLSSFEELSQKLPPHLTVLRLNAGLLKTIRVDQLSMELQSLQISEAELKSIVGTKWPQNLNDIDFSGNELGDNGFEVINNIGWTERLTKLNLCCNGIS